MKLSFAYIFISALTLLMSSDAFASQPSQAVCANLFSDRMLEELSPIALRRGYVDNIERVQNFLGYIGSQPALDSITARDQGVRLARLVLAEAAKDPSAFYRLVYVVLKDFRLHYSGQLYDAFLSDVFKGSFQLTSLTDKHAKGQAFFNQLLEHAFTSALRRELRETEGMPPNIETLPILYYSKQTWIPSAKALRAETILMSHWLQKFSQPFPSDEAVEKESRVLAFHIKKNAADDLHVYVRFYILVMSRFNIARGAAFYRGLLDDHFAKVFTQLDAKTQNLLAEYLKLAETKINAGSENKISLSIPSVRAIPAKDEQKSLPIAALKMTSFKGIANEETILQFIKKLNQSEIESELLQAENGRTLASMIESASGGNPRSFIKFFAFTLKENPRPLHPTARETFKTNMIQIAQTLRLPPTQIEALRRLLTESRSEALDRINELGWLDD